MELKDIIDKIGTYTAQALKQRQQLDTAYLQFHEGSDKGKEETDTDRQLQQALMEKLHQTLQVSIYLLETYFVILKRKNPSDKNDKKLKEDTLDQMDRTLVSLYNGQYYFEVDGRKPSEKVTPMAKALTGASSQFFEDAIRISYLLGRKAKEYATLTPQQVAALQQRSYDVVEAAIYFKQDIQAPLRFGIEDGSPLHFAVLGGCAELAGLLLQQKAKIEEGMLRAAIRANNAEMVAVLCKHGAKATEQEFTAAAEQEIALVAALMNGGDNAGYPFDELVAGYLIERWTNSGHQSIDYLIAEGALGEANLARFQAKLNEDKPQCTDMQFAVICGNTVELVRMLRELECIQEDLNDLLGAIEFAAFGGRVDLTRYLLSADLTEQLFMDEAAVARLGKLVSMINTVSLDPDEKAKVINLLFDAGLRHGKNLNQAVLEEDAVVVTRSTLRSSTDFVIADIKEHEIDRYREGGKSYIAYLWDTNNPKANDIEAAMHRANEARDAKGDMGADEYLSHKKDDLPSVAEALAAPRLGFFAASGYSNVLKRLEAFRKQRDEQQEEQRSGNTNGM